MTRTSLARVEIGMVIYLRVPGIITLNFTYDPDGIALGVNLNGTDYYYLYNAQGDVIALYDSTGTIVTEYKYDSWGKLLSTTGSGASTIGTLNPLRYRGYFYDTDLSLYLLETRYYDPETGRFINADGVFDNRGVETTNLYAYCANNPINNKDSNGNLSVNFGAALVNGVAAALHSGIKTFVKNKGAKNRVKLALHSAAKEGAKGLVEGFALGGVGGKALKAAKKTKVAAVSKKLAVKYVKRSAFAQGAYSFGKSYVNRVKPIVKQYPSKIREAVTYVPPSNRTASSYERFLACNAELGRTLIPTRGDVCAGLLAATTTVMAGRVKTSWAGLDDFESAVNNSDLAESGIDFAASLVQALFEDMVASLYPGETS